MGTMGHQPATIIGFYKKSCRDFFLKLDFLNTVHYPGRPFLTIGWYDFERRPKESWFLEDPHVNLEKMLNSTNNCPGLLFGFLKRIYASLTVCENFYKKTQRILFILLSFKFKKVK